MLLVEDEEGVRAVAAEYLRDLGHTVLEAGDGPAALRLLRLGPRVDLLVTDVGLPGGMNGRQIADAARERKAGPACAVHHGLCRQCARRPARAGHGDDRQAICAGRPRRQGAGHAGGGTHRVTCGVGPEQGAGQPCCR